MRLAGFAVGIGAGNLIIAGLAIHARGRRLLVRPAGVTGIKNLFAVDEHLWRGGAPTAEGYRSLAAAGVRTVIDLRAESGGAPPSETGMTVARFPIRDGQPPTPLQVDAINKSINGAAKTVFVHCAAGVGRTGSTVAAYLVLEKGVGNDAALHSMLSVGPPSLEQIAFVRALGPDHANRAPTGFVVLSRVLDAPRRTLSRVRELFS